MRILICAEEIPLPPLTGLRLPLFELCRRLAGRHEVTLLGFREAGQHGEGPPGIELHELPYPHRSRARRVSGWLRATASGTPVSSLRFVPELGRRARVLRHERSFDLVHVSGGALAAVSTALRPLPALIAPLDAMHLNLAARRRLAPAWLHWAYRLEEGRLKRHVRDSFRAYARVVVVSEEDAQAYRELEPGLPLVIIPNGVQLERFRPNPEVERERGHIVFLGTMSAAPNIEAAHWLARELLPRVRAARPEAHLSLVGRAPPPEVLKLGSLEGVQVTGEVPDVRPWLWRAEVFACAMRSGTGIKNKLLESLASGSPSVATPLACQGLQVRDGRELLVAGDESTYAAAVVELLDRPDLRQRLSAAGVAYARSHHSWDRTAEAYESQYEEILAERSTSSCAPLGQGGAPR